MESSEQILAECLTGCLVRKVTIGVFNPRLALISERLAPTFSFTARSTFWTVSPTAILAWLNDAVTGVSYLSTAPLMDMQSEALMGTTGVYWEEGMEVGCRIKPVMGYFFGIYGLAYL